MVWVQNRQTTFFSFILRKLVVNYRSYLGLFHRYSFNVAALLSIQLTIPMLVCHESPWESEPAEHIVWFPGHEFTTICHPTSSSSVTLFWLSDCNWPCGLNCISAEQQLWGALRTSTWRSIQLKTFRPLWVMNQRRWRLWTSSVRSDP